jgi:hypothetical protein
MGKNGYLQRQKIRDTVYQQAATDTERQYLVDLFCIVLNDPAVMGHNALGKVRLTRVVKAVAVEYDRWKEALTTHDEADYYRAKMDAILKDILGDDLVPFEKRYDWIKDVPPITKKK